MSERCLLPRTGPSSWWPTSSSRQTRPGVSVQRTQGFIWTEKREYAAAACNIHRCKVFWYVRSIFGWSQSLNQEPASKVNFLWTKRWPYKLQPGCTVMWSAILKQIWTEQSFQIVWNLTLQPMKAEGAFFYELQKLSQFYARRRPRSAEWSIWSATSWLWNRILNHHSTHMLFHVK